MMKCIKNLFSIVLFSLSLITMNTMTVFANERCVINSEMQQLELIEEVLSDVQEENTEINGYSMLDSNHVYGDSTYSEANMVNYNITTKVTSFENFNMNSYQNRNASTQSASSLSLSSFSNIDENTFDSRNIEFSESYITEDMQSAISPTSILGSDDRSLVTNTRSWPYRGIVKMYMTFNNVLKKSDGKYYNRTYVGTGFMEGPNLMVTAGHCAYSDVTSDGDYEDGISNPRFPDSIRVYAGVNGSSEISSSYIYYAEVSIINIQKEYYENPSFDYDWSAMQLDRNLGNQTGYYGKISNWYSENAPVYSYGYPGDKPATMWETHGNLVGKSTYRYSYNFDTVGGQSGSPVFMTSDTGATYVCGIHTSGGSSSNGATRINSFIFHYLNSFVI